MTTTTDDLHVIFGAGQVGPLLAEVLLRAGHRVRVVRRSDAAVTAGVEVLRGDATDREFCRIAASGASAVYHCMNPPYTVRDWARDLPRYTENLVAAAGRVKARLVVLDNLYLLGRTGGRAITEETPVNPVSRKGEIRAEVTRWLLEGERRGDVRAVIGRASDFYGPRGAGTHFGPLFWRAALAGKPALFLPRADTPHTYHYIPDVAAALALLGTAQADDVTGRTWMLPCAPATTSRELVDRFEAPLGRAIRLRSLPRPLVALMGAVVPVMRELREMAYQWEEPFVVDDARFRGGFAFTPAESVAAAAETVAWARTCVAG